MNSKNTELSEQELLEAFLNGDRTAFTTIYQLYWHKMYIVAYRKLKDKQAAEEIIQDIFVKLWKNRATVHITRLDYYLFTAVRYSVIDHIRSEIVQGEYEEYYKTFLSLEDSNTENTIAFNELISTITNGLDILPEKSREVFRLNRLEHWPVAQIAEHLDLSEKAVEYHLTKSLKSMRVYLKDHLFIFLILFSSFL
ncbi:RNA polymerase sigma-70 factor [Xanthocytophaga agilis]|uniref:RNA polymerase sigma-70 factor n=1 Tax=Xanthocytophaga agilis TaxID=3048010 RepID=A0AAE3UHS9_9BACT|nr:RNA polymerase sigma-70 factor [Xanthocytophaga agilis]MDJ1503822.1 RNA polymerase sigma-70 factor [Xanthocytophaga agilis]